MEKDSELKGDGNSYTTYFREFDVRLGRTFVMDPVLKAGRSPYDMMSNSPIIKIDPKGDDDYYNERGQYLYSDTRTSDNIRIITQANFEKIVYSHFNEIFDYSKTHLGLLRDLTTNSKVVKNKVTGSDYKNLLTKSNLDKPVYDIIHDKGTRDSGEYRKEQSALIVLDVKSAEIRMIVMNDENNNETTSLFQNVSPLERNSDVMIYNDNPNFIIIGTIHTHPINKLGEKGFGYSSDKPSFHTQDQDTFLAWGAKVPFVQLYPEGINQVDVLKKGPDLDNFTTTKKVLKNGEAFTKQILEINGGKQNQ